MGMLERLRQKQGLESISLLPGEYHATQQNIILTTILGSCVAACLSDLAAGVGGMNHFLLPGKAIGSGSTQAQQRYRYGQDAMDQLIADMLSFGAQKQRIEAKVFGGGFVVEQLRSHDVGRANAHFVLGYLDAQGIRIVAKDLQGNKPRRLCFLPLKGQAFVKYI